MVAIACLLLAAVVVVPVRQEETDLALLAEQAEMDSLIASLEPLLLGRVVVVREDLPREAQVVPAVVVLVILEQAVGPLEPLILAAAAVVPLRQTNREMFIAAALGSLSFE